MLEWVKGNIYNLVLTLYPSNITLNSSAASYFQDVRWSMIGLDKEYCQLAIRPVTKREVDLNLVPLDQLHKVSVGKGYARISNKAIIEEVALMLHTQIEGLKVNAVYDEKENMLLADLSQLVRDKR